MWSDIYMYSYLCAHIHMYVSVSYAYSSQYTYAYMYTYTGVCGVETIWNKRSSAAMTCIYIHMFTNINT